MKYNIIRFYQDRSKKSRIIERNFTLEEAQAYCKNPETSSSTAKTKDSYTKRVGAWLDGYEQA